MVCCHCVRYHPDLLVHIWEGKITSNWQVMQVPVVERVHKAIKWINWFWLSLVLKCCWATYNIASCPYCLPRIPFRYENRSARQYWSSQSLPLACLRSWLKFNFAGMPTGKICNGASCHWSMFLFVQEVAQVVLAASSQLHQWHTRTTVLSAG